MIIKLSKPDGATLYLNSAFVLLAEEHPLEWQVTIAATVLVSVGATGAGIRGVTAPVSRVLRLDQAGAAALIRHLEVCHVNRQDP